MQGLTLGEGSKLAFDDEVYVLTFASQGDFDATTVNLYYSSLAKPGTWMAQNMATGRRAVQKVTNVLGGFDQRNYTTRRLWATSHDGVKVRPPRHMIAPRCTPQPLAPRKCWPQGPWALQDGRQCKSGLRMCKNGMRGSGCKQRRRLHLQGHVVRHHTHACTCVQVPVSLVYNHTMVEPQSEAALHLDAYGAYEVINEPSFRRNRVSLLDRGVVCAIAHVRGGGDLGRLWYERGKFLDKRNTFLDVVAVAEHLCSERWTSPSRMVLEGRSAGGMTVGAVANMRPDLFQVRLVPCMHAAHSLAVCAGLCMPLLSVTLGVPAGHRCRCSVRGLPDDNGAC
jgi:prolyl oligopeptidase PreP (S9A serine peptidase family)